MTFPLQPVKPSETLEERMSLLVWFQIIVIGLGATFIMDLWAWIQKKLLGIPSLNYALVARWVLYIPSGQWVHTPIMNTSPATRETELGWFLHYAIGVIFALIHVLIMGAEWLKNPTMIPSLVTGIVTIIFPFFIIQPCLGFGIAACKTPYPWKSRLLSLLAHLAYGAGIFITAYMMSFL